MSKFKIAVYFGSFDPIHINHISLCIDLISHGFHKIYLVANENNTLKPYMVSHNHRNKMINLAILECELSDYLIAYSSGIQNHDWDGRSQICNKIMENHIGDQIYQIIGQDSYENALQRCHFPNGIYALKGRILIVYPRQGYCDNIRIPAELSDSIILMSDYSDKYECSSTNIRQKLMKNCVFEELNQLTYLSVYNYLIDNKLYCTLKNTKKIIVILGPPGSGKGTLSESLIKKYPKYIHISTGDLYRNDMIKKTPAYLVVDAEKHKGHLQYMQALNKFIIDKLKVMIDPIKYYIIDGLKPTDLFNFEKEIALIDSIVILNCVYKVAFDRLKKRQKEQKRFDDNDELIKKRLGNYYRFIWMQKEIIKSYSGTGRQAINLNCDKSIQILINHKLWSEILQK